MTRLNELLARALRAHDVEVMFGVMGDANMYIADSFHRASGGRFVASANEGGAVLMAAGYAAVTGSLGVVTVTHGAIANCVSALLDAVKGRYPVLVVAGATARDQAFHLQTIAQREVVAATGASYRPVRSARTAAADLAAAVAEARASRKPVVLEVPADIQQAEVDDAGPPVVVPEPGVLEPAPGALEEAAGAIIGARRPLVLAGRGASDPGTADAVRSFAERVGAPVVTTLRGKGLFAKDPWDLGIMGTLAHPVATDTLVASDCLIAFGAGLTPLTTMKGELLAGKRVVQVDTDPAAVGRFSPVDIGVVGDCARVAAGLAALLDEAEAAPSGFRSAALAERLAEWTERDRATARGTGPLDITGVLHRVDQLVPSGRTLAIDGGRFSHEALRIVGVERPRDYAHCLNVGHIGMGVGYGIGAAIGRSDAPGLVIVGDGGFMLGGLTEFNTAVRNSTRLIVVLLNDGAYGAEYYRFVGQELDPSLTTFDWPGFAGIAEALGGAGVTVRAWEDFERAEAAVRAADGPVLIEVILDRDAIPDPGEH